MCNVVGYTMDTVYFGWLDSPVEIDADVQFPQFKYIDNLLYDCSMNYTAGITLRPTYLSSQYVIEKSWAYLLLLHYKPGM